MRIECSDLQSYISILSPSLALQHISSPWLTTMFFSSVPISYNFLQPISVLWLPCLRSMLESYEKVLTKLSKFLLSSWKPFIYSFCSIITFFLFPTSPIAFLLPILFFTLLAVIEHILCTCFQWSKDFQFLFHLSLSLPYFQSANLLNVVTN